MATPRIRYVQRTRRISRLLAWLLAPFMVGTPAWAQGLPAPSALPQGGQLRVGSGQITQTGQLLLIQQTSARLGIDWQSFHIGSDATVEFRQPDAGSVALNRVVGHEPSAIFGKLKANGQVFLTNPNGVLFAPGAKVDVGGLIASTLDLSQSDFAAGRYDFTGDGGAVRNQGHLRGSGYVALFGGTVANEGEIEVAAGSVVLASGRVATVSVSDSGLLSAVLTPGQAGAVLNSGRVAADGGTVRLSAQSAEGVAASLVNNTGIVRANGIVERAGEIYIIGDQVASTGQLNADGSLGAAGGRIVVLGDLGDRGDGSAQIGGQLSARALDAGGAGGSIETSAASIHIAADTQVDTRAADGRHGTWLIDPTDFVVNAGGGTQTASGIGADTLAGNLAQGNITLQTAPQGNEAGDIRIEAPVSWSADTTLTLSAAADIEINANLSATGNAAGLTLSAGSGNYSLADGVTVSLPGSSPTLQINGTNYLVINTLDALQAMGQDATARGRSYALGSDIDASATAGWNNGLGFVPVGFGTSSNAFRGNFDGLGHTISGLTINRPGAVYAGLFGYAQNALISHVHLDGGSVEGGVQVGAVVGYLYGFISSTERRGGLRNVSSNVAVVGSPSGSTSYAGGLAGRMEYTEGLRGVSGSGAVTADTTSGAAGGLVGRMVWATEATDLQATGAVVISSLVGGQSFGYAGGAIGYAFEAAISDATSTGAVQGGYYTGGLIGNSDRSTVSNASASGSVLSTGNYSGGLVGYADQTVFSNVQASGSVFSSGYSGGLVGFLFRSPVTGGAASGSAIGRFDSGGLAGYVSESDITGGQASGAVQSTTARAGGLVGYVTTSAFTDVSASGQVAGDDESGGLVGRADSTSITNGQASGDVTSTRQEVGGLVGRQNSGSIIGSSASGDVTTSSSDYAGGLVGSFYGSDGAGIRDSQASGQVLAGGYGGGLVGFAAVSQGDGIINSQASGDVSASFYGGGLVGYLSSFRENTATVVQGSLASGQVRSGNIAGGLVGYWQGYGSRIEDSGATGAVTAGTSSVYNAPRVGGLVGYLVDNGDAEGGGNDYDGLQIARSFASGDVGIDPSRVNDTMTVYAGGLVGQASRGQAPKSNQSSALIDSYATGRVEVRSGGGSTFAGGLVGANSNLDIIRSYSSGAVVDAGGGSNDAVGGLAGSHSGGTVSASVWNLDTSGQATSAAGTGLSDADMRQAASFGTWDLATSAGAGSVWRLYEGQTQPLLASFLRPLTLQAADAAKTYDGTNSLAGTGLTDAAGAPVADPQFVFVAGAGPNAGSYTFTASDLYSSQGGYDLQVLSVGGSSTLTIGARALTLSGIVADKVYDRSTAASFVADPMLGELSGLVAGDDLVLDLSAAAAAFTDVNVGAGKLVNISGFVIADGVVGLAANYSVQGTALADITPAPVTAGGFSVVDRVYDGSTAVDVNFNNAGALTGVIAGDSVSLSLSAVGGQMADRHVGTDKPVTVSGVSLAGAQAGNYVLAGVDALTVDITPKPITVTGLVANNKTYNASTVVNINPGAAQFSGLVDGDGVFLNASGITGNTTDKNVGTGLTVTVTGLTLLGPDAGNYVPETGTLTVDVAKRNLSVFAFGSANQHFKVYDGNNLASATVYDSGGYSSDDLIIAWDSITYADKNVAYNGSGVVTSKPITVAGISVTGADAANYTLQNTSYTFNGRIDPRPLAVTGVTAQDRVYDGTANVAVDLGSVAVDTSTVVAGDVVSVTVPPGGTVTGTLANKNVGTDRAVSVPGLSLAGADAANYTLNAANGVTVDIAPKPLTVAYTGIDRVYDGSVFAFVSASTDDIVSGDDVTFYTNNFCQTSYCGFSAFTGDGAKNVGSAKPISITYEFLYGVDRNNYVIANFGEGTATASITARPITPVVLGVDKVYDGTTAASVTLNRSASNIVNTDAVDVATSTAVFSGVDGRNAGTNKPVAVSAITLSGADAGNYSLASDTAATTASITPKPVSVSGVVAVDRVYDGTLDVAVNATTPAVVGLIAGDDATPLLPPGGVSTGTMQDRHAGQDKPVTVTGLSLTGADAANYTLTGGAGTVNILPLGITVSYTGIDKVYDGSTIASVVGSAAALVAGDSLGFTQLAQFTGTGARNAGSNKPVGISGILLTGVDAGNYVLLSDTATTTASITPKPITASYTGVSRVYNGVADRSAVVIGSSTGLVAGDSVGFNQMARFSGDGSAGGNKAIDVTDIALSGVNAGNYLLSTTTATTTANITPRSLGVTGLTAIDRVYDGTVTVQVEVDQAQVDLTGVLAGDEVTVALPPAGVSTGNMTDRHVGADKAVSVSGLLLGGASAANYTLSGGSGLTVNITPATLTAVYAGVDKVYDGGTAASVIGSSADVLGIDNVGIAATGVFSGGKNVGTAKAVDVSGGFLTGTDRNNYSLANATGSTTASITPRALTAVYSGSARVYDGGVSAPVTAVLNGLVGGDAVQATQLAVFTGTGARNVGQNKPIDVSGIAISGTDAGNYALTTDTAAAAGSITPKPIVIEGLTGVTAASRVYDGSTVVSVTVPDDISGQPRDGDLIAGDSVTVSVPPPGTTTGTLADRHVGDGKAVVITGLSLSGPDAGNYLISGAGGVTVDITPLSISASYFGVNKVYDGSTLAGVEASSAGFFGIDDVSIAANGVFDGGKNVGVAKSVTVTGGLLAGADAGNYLLDNPEGSTTASITPRSVSAVYTGGTRVYDGSTAAPVNGLLAGAIDGDVLSLSQSAEFTGAGAKNVGNDKAVSVSGISLSGDDAGNYTLASNATTTTGSITPRPIVIDGLTVTATDRTYDGTVNVAVEVLGSDGAAPQPGDLIAGDDVTVAVPPPGTSVGTMADKHAGVDKAVVVQGLTLAGADAANYEVVGASGLTVTIAPRTLTAVWAGQDKVYDGTSLASVLGTTADLLAGDSLVISGSGVFSSGKNVGAGLGILVTAGSLSGDDALNYTLSNPNGSASAAITPLTISAVYAGLTRVYDGSTTAPVSGSLDGAIAGDVLSLSQTAAFIGAGARNVGADKAVAVSGITLAGADAGNYQLATDSAATTASITPRPLTVSGLDGLSAVDRVYDGTLGVAVSGDTSGGTVTIDGVIAGDDVSLAQAGGAITAGTMADKHAGQGKAVVVDGLGLVGADAGNYSLGGVLGLTVNIAPRAVSVTGLTAVGRVYDGSTLVALDTSGGAIAGLLAGDDLALLADGATGAMADRHVGTGKAVTLTGVAVAGADAGNYVLQPSAALTVDITPRGLALAATAQAKVYDGSTAAQVDYTDDRLAGDALSITHQNAAFANAGAGTGKAVSVSGLALVGDDAANYQLGATDLSLLANIDPRALSLQAMPLAKVYGESLVFDGTEFSATGLVAGETVGTVLLGSAGSIATAGVGTYAITLAGATGGSFDPANYVLAYAPGSLTVTPRPLTVATNTVVRFADEPNPAAFGFSTGQGGLVNGDRIASVQQAVPAGSVDAPGGSVFELRPQDAAFAAGNAANYELRYSSGLLIVLPRPPRIGDTDSGGAGGDDPQFAVVLDPAELAAAEEVLRRNSAQLQAIETVRASDAGVAPSDQPLPDAVAADVLAALLRGKTQEVTLPTLLRLPLISWDPALRRLILGDPTRPGPQARSAPRQVSQVSPR